MTIRFKQPAADGRVETHESRKGPEGGAWTLSLLAAIGLVISDSRRRGVLGRRSSGTATNVNNGGHHEQ